MIYLFKVYALVTVTVLLGATVTYFVLSMVWTLVRWTRSLLGAVNGLRSDLAKTAWHLLASVGKPVPQNRSPEARTAG